MSADSHDLTPDERRLYALVPADGSTISNPAVQGALNLSDADYWKIRDSLVDKRRITRGRGRGGTLRRVIDSSPDLATVSVPLGVVDGKNAVAQVEAAVRRELDLYDPIATVLKGDWAKDRRASPLAIEITALQGRRATGGTWSRPDIVSVEIKTYAFVPGKFLEIITFEVKPADAINVQAVYESLAHRRSATHSYVVLHVPTSEATQLAELIEDVRAVARSHGIGVIVVGEPDDYNTWEELEEAHRFEPDPDRLEQFITTQLSDRTKTKIARALR